MNQIYCPSFSAYVYPPMRRTLLKTKNSHSSATLQSCLYTSYYQYSLTTVHMPVFLHCSHAPCPKAVTSPMHTAIRRFFLTQSAHPTISPPLLRPQKKDTVLHLSTETVEATQQSIRCFLKSNHNGYPVYKFSEQSLHVSLHTAKKLSYRLFDIR